MIICICIWFITFVFIFERKIGKTFVFVFLFDKTKFPYLYLYLIKRSWSQPCLKLYDEYGLVLYVCVCFVSSFPMCVVLARILTLNKVMHPIVFVHFIFKSNFLSVRINVNPSTVSIAILHISNTLYVCKIILCGCCEILLITLESK